MYCNKGTTVEAEEQPAPATSRPSQSTATREPEQQYQVEAVDQVVALLGAIANQGPADGRANPLEAFLGPGSLQQLLGIPPDADETVVQIAIALSLEDHEDSADIETLRQGFETLRNLGGSILQNIQALAAQGMVQTLNTAQVKLVENIRALITIRKGEKLIYSVRSNLRVTKEEAITLIQLHPQVVRTTKDQRLLPTVVL